MMPTSPPLPTPLTWDIFCRVIDNYGDIGVCWRLCKALVARGQTVRFITDDASALAWMAAPPELAAIAVIPWSHAACATGNSADAADVVIEVFGCELPSAYVAKMARKAKQDKASCWINLEYLTAEPYAQSCHLLPSPVMHGVGQGLTKTFFYPGFTRQTGGLIRESNLPSRQQTFDKAAWLKQQNIEWQGRAPPDRIISLFCYEPSALPNLLAQLQNSASTSLILVAFGRSAKAVAQAQQALQAIDAPQTNQNKAYKNLHVHFLPPLTQEDYDHVLWASDFNFVRGEDSLVRAIWAGKPFVWQIYPQDDNAHHAKLAAFLDTYLQNIDATAAATAAHIRAVHRIWNDISKNDPASHILIDLQAWQSVSLAQRDLWGDLPDLVEPLIQTATHVSS